VDAHRALAPERPVGRAMVEILTVAGLLLGGLVASEIGYRLGLIFSPKLEVFGRQFDIVRTATFALVAFLIAFSFSGAGSRYVERGDVIVEEANALGTAWLRADVLPEPQRSELKAVIKEYTNDRVVLLTARDRPEMMRLLAKVGGLHGKMWTQALAGTDGNAPLMAVVLPSINDVIDLHTTHLALAIRRLPTPILVVLLATSALSLMLVGFGNGHAGRRFPLLDGTYAIVLAVALWMTIDLDRPRQGIIQVNPQPMVDALASMT
jgi:hypothetical protein